MVTFLLISDIDKNSKSWYEWIPYNNLHTVFSSDFVDQLKSLGNVYLPQPNFVNFRKYAQYDNNQGYTDNIMFSIEDLQFENYSEWLYNQIDEIDRNNIIVIGFEQGCHIAKYFSNRYHRECSSVFILGDRVLTKQNYEKIQNDSYYDSLKRIFGKEWNNYKIENMNNVQLHKILTDLESKDIQRDNYVEFLNGYIKLYTRSQYAKITRALVPMYIYTYSSIQTEENDRLHKEFVEHSKPVYVEYYYLEEDAPYFIFGKYKDEIITNIKNIYKVSGGAIDIIGYDRYKKYKSKYLQLKNKIGGNKNKTIFLFFNGGGLTEKQWYIHPYKGLNNFFERTNENKTSDLIDKIKKIGDIHLYTPSFYLTKDDIINGKSFTFLDLELVKHVKELHKNISEYGKIFIISHSRGNILAKFFCKLYYEKVIGYINIDGGESDEWYKSKLIEWGKKYNDINETKLKKLFKTAKKGNNESVDIISRIVKYKMYQQSYQYDYDFSNINMLVLNNIYNDSEISINDKEYVDVTLKSKFSFNKQFENSENVKSVFYVGKTHYLYFYNDVVDDIINYINGICNMQ